MSSERTLAEDIRIKKDQAEIKIKYSTGKVVYLPTSWRFSKGDLFDISLVEADNRTESDS